MLPKRKIIRKQYTRPQNTNEGQQTAPASIFEKLKSIDSTYKQQALAFISSLCIFQEGNNQILILAELVTILYQGTTSLVHQCLYAIANLCEIATWIISRLFQFGLDKALTQLNSNDKLLLKPIMALMNAVSQQIPTQFRYLIEGVQASLTADHFSQSQESILTFLLRTQAKQIRPELLEKIYQFFNSHDKFRARSLCLSVLLNNQTLQQQEQFLKIILNFLQQIIVDLNLENQFKTNLIQNKPIKHGNTEVSDQMEDQEQQPVGYTTHPNYETFLDAVQGAELLLQQIIKIIEGQEWSDDQEIDEDNEIQQQILSSNQSTLKQQIIKFFINNYPQLLKYSSLSFIEGQNIVSLVLRLIVLTLPHLNEDAKHHACIKAVQSMNKAINLQVQEDIFTQIFISGLFILMKCGLPQQLKKSLIHFGSIMKIKQNFKDCWIFWLEAVSANFNPEKKSVNFEQNKYIGQVLKNLIINIPKLELQQWRAQAIDTVFDVYSNEQFDNTFKDLGFLQILEAILERCSGGKKKKFIKEVLTDIKRFLQYKKKMIKF